MSTMRKEQCNNDERIPENLRTRLPGLAGHNRRIHFRNLRQATDPAEGRYLDQVFEIVNREKESED